VTYERRASKQQQVREDDRRASAPHDINDKARHGEQQHSRDRAQRGPQRQLPSEHRVERVGEGTRRGESDDECGEVDGERQDPE